MSASGTDKLAKAAARKTATVEGETLQAALVSLIVRLPHDERYHLRRYLELLAGMIDAHAIGGNLEPKEKRACWRSIVSHVDTLTRQPVPVEWRRKPGRGAKPVRDIIRGALAATEALPCLMPPSRGDAATRTALRPSGTTGSASP